MTRFSGFSLIETMLGIALGTLMTGVVMTALVDGSVAFDSIQLSQQRSSDALLAFKRMRSTIELARALPTSAPGIPQTFSAPSTLLVNLPGKKADGTHDTSLTDYIVYSYDTANKRLLEITYPDPSSTRTATNQIIATNISAVTFTRDTTQPSYSATIALTITQTGQLGRQVATIFTETILTRNTTANAQN